MIRLIKRHSLLDVSRDRNLRACLGGVEKLYRRIGITLWTIAILLDVHALNVSGCSCDM